MKVYLVIRTNFDDYEILAIYANEKDAERRAKKEMKNRFITRTSIDGERFKDDRGQFGVIDFDLL